MIRAVILLAIIMQCQFARCQFTTYRSRLQLNTALGVNLPLSKLEHGDLSDQLSEFSDQSNSLQVMSVAWFFKKHWGVELGFQGGFSREIGKKKKRFNDGITAAFQNEYYVDAENRPYISENHFNIASISKTYLGIVYRYEMNRFFIYPKFSIGVTSFITNWGRAYLKERNTNQTHLIQYDPDEHPQDHFTIALSSKTGIKLSRRFYFNIDILGAFYKPNFYYTRTMTNLVTEQKQVETISYNKNIFALTLGAGIIYVAVK